MPSYWVRLGAYGHPYMPDTPEESLPIKALLANKIWEQCHPEINPIGTDFALIYKTDSLENAKATLSRAQEIIRATIIGEWGYFDPGEWGFDLGISAQPECHNCQYVGQLGEGNCPKCGTELLAPEDIEGV